MPQSRRPRRTRARASRAAAREAGSRQLPKAPSGIRGLDEITGGGLPRGRPTLVCGGAGCGKTLFAMEFLVRGAVDHGEPGVFMAFEETAKELAANVASLGFDLERLEKQKKLAIDWVRVERSEIEETGEYDLEGLFVRLQHAIDSIGAKRVVLDTVEALFAGLANPAILRAELRRLFRWLKDRGQTVVITGERGDGHLTRYGLEEYVSDCVIVLDHRVIEQVSTRRLRIVKYRGSVHGTNEYPFLIDQAGLSILPITSLGLDHPASSERLSSGIPRLDEMLGGRGYFRGSTVLVSGTAGTGKTSVAALLARSVCGRGQRCLLFALEESPAQILRNLRSIGVDLTRHVRGGTLRIVAARPYAAGLELHLVSILNEVREFEPSVVIIDPISNLIAAGSPVETRAMLTRLIDYLKSRRTTLLFTSLTTGGGDLERTEVGVSSLIDTWLMLGVVETGGERNRTLTIIKSRGMEHSNQTSEYVLGRRGLTLLDTYLGATGVVTGSARVAREEEDRAAASARADDVAQKRALLESRRKVFDARLTTLRENFEAEAALLQRSIRAAEAERERLTSARTSMAASRKAFTPAAKRGAAGNGGRR
jgi:circadian clock protein KaiC